MEYSTNADDVIPFDPRATIQVLKDLGHGLAAHHMEVMLAAWERTLGAYHSALGSVNDDAARQLHVVTHTISDIWGPKILTVVPLPNREQAQREHDADVFWHKYGPESDRALR
jgi:hypothetical protein